MVVGCSIAVTPLCIVESDLECVSGVLYCIVLYKIFKQDHRKSIENLSGYSPVSVYVCVRDGERERERERETETDRQTDRQTDRKRE